MIPGNRPEDIAEEEWWNEFEKKTDEKDIPIPAESWDEKWFVDTVNLAKEIGYAEGYNDGRDEERQSAD